MAWTTRLFCFDSIWTDRTFSWCFLMVESGASGDVMMMEAKELAIRIQGKSGDANLGCHAIETYGL
jgi:hypothetical protein